MYVKDALGRDLAIVKFEPGGTSKEFYVYGNERVAMISPNTGGTTPSRIQHNEATFFLTDHLGNTRVAYMAANSSMAYIINAADYYPYGKILREYDNGAADRYLSTEHERDRETGLDYRGARYYDVARFLSTDPWADQFPAWSTYTYVLGNPIVFIDPTGKGAEDWVKKPNGSIVWDPNAISPETTQEGDKYVGKSGKGTDDEGNMVTYNPDGTKSVQNESQTVVIGYRKSENTTPTSKTPWMETALQELKLGVKEVPKGSNSGPRIDMYLKYAGVSLSNKAQDKKWCASFVHWCLGQNGIKGAGARGKDYLKWGVKLDKPKYGAIAVFTTGHVGFYMETNKDGTLKILHGNWSDKLKISSGVYDPIYPKDIQEYRFPSIK